MKRFLLMPFVLLSVAATLIAVRTTHAEDWSIIARLDRALDSIVPADAKVEKIGENFGFLEGPVWVSKGGYLLFSDIPANVIYKYSPTDKKTSVFLPYSGFTGADDSDAGMQLNNGRTMVTLLGSNAVTIDPQGRVVYCAHGDHAIIRIESDGKRTVLANEFEGKRLNSPNDLVFKSDGALYFTDPPAGLRDADKDAKRELPYTGIYLLKDGKLQLLTKDLRPNGLAFTPDEKHIYLVDTTGGKKSIRRFAVKDDDTITDNEMFIDMTSDTMPGGPDGMKVDQKGNLYSSGPGGVWIMSPEGKHLGSIVMNELPANLAFGDADAKTLYMTARTGLYRIRLSVPGIRPK